MGADAAVKMLYRKDLEKATDRRTLSAELTQQYRDSFASPYEAGFSLNFYIIDVIEPCQTQATVSLSLRNC